MNSINHVENSIQILKSVFGYETFRPLQENIITKLINNESCSVIMPTGSGKSLCFQIPAICKEGLGVVISPLIALMQDQCTTLTQMGVKVACLNSSLSFDEQYEVIEAVEMNQLDLLYVAPERALTEEFTNLLRKVDLALFAIDEAHCVSQWGHDFRPQYLQLNQLLDKFVEVPRVALTATADEATRNEIRTQLNIPSENEFIGGFDRENIHYEISLKNNPKKQLIDFIEKEEEGSSGIVYCLSRKKVDEIAAYLSSCGYRAFPYHAGLSSDRRTATQNKFIRQEGIIIVATVAFGMGIDKPDVRYVVHFDLPSSIEAYSQETGRAGRDGEPAKAWMIYGFADVAKRGSMIQSSLANEQRKRIESRKLNSLLGLCETTKCRREVILNYFGEKYTGVCKNCDTCLNPVEQFNGTEDAQKILSCIYRTDQMFGAGHVIDVLIGKETEKVRKFRHQNLKVFGVGKDKSVREWSSIIRQLVAADYLKVDVERFGSIKLTEKSRDILTSKKEINFRIDPGPAKKYKSKRANNKVIKSNFKENPTANALWEKLKEKRLKLARDQNVPPYMIFQDKSLIEMVEQKPSNDSEFLAINGVGESKLAKYGDLFMSVIREVNGNIKL